jgi:dodecin
MREQDDNQADDPAVRLDRRFIESVLRPISSIWRNDADRANKEEHWRKEMADTVYKVVELIGTSDKSWEDAAKSAVERAGKSIRDLRIAEVVEQDLIIDGGKVGGFRAKIKVSFKYEGGD